MHDRLGRRLSPWCCSTRRRALVTIEAPAALVVALALVLVARLDPAALVAALVRLPALVTIAT